MTIASRLKINALLSAGIMLIISLVFAMAFLMQRDALERVTVANRFMKGTFELNNLTNRYLRAPEERPKEQWLIVYEALANDLKKVPFKRHGQQVLLRRMSQNLNDMSMLFEELVATHEQGRPDATGFASDRAAFAEMRNQLANLILTRSREISLDASRLAAASNEEIEDINRNIMLFLPIAVFVMIVIALWSSARIGRSITGPISTLRAGTAIIGSGDLDYRIGIATYDEIGQLSRAFDHMTEQLKITSVSRDALAHEVSERKRAEDQLKRSKKLSDALNNLNTIIHSTLEVNAIMQRVVTGAAKAVGVDGASIGLFEDDSFIIRYAYNLPQELVNQVLPSSEVKGIHYMASVRDVIVVEDAFTDERLNVRFWGIFNIRSLIAAPLLVREKVIGALSVYCIESKEICTDDYVDFTRKLASSLSLALENAHLYDERKGIEEAMRHMAHHDTLTGLPNRRLFMDIVTIELAQAHRSHRKLAVLFLDLDRFKEVNDTLGHEAGDELLQEVARRLRANIRESDTVARIGGDEFNITLTDIAHAEDIAVIAQKIMHSFQSPFLIAGHSLHITASIGISVYPDDSEEIDTLFRFADIAMYYAKELGKNTYRFYDPAINIRSIERMKFESYLRQAIERGELSVYYQPQIDIRTGRIICAEALVRWRHPELGLLPAKRFIPAAEETGFITSMDEWVLRTACAQCKAWYTTGDLPVCVTVNLSARGFQNPELVATIARILDETGLSPDCLDIEITESMAMHDMENTTKQLNELTAMGVCISIDDFGTGYSSLSYLKRLPVQRLKIDRSFVKDIMIDPGDRAIIKAITAMAHTMKMRVVVEGVETEEQLSFLRETQCDEAQGYLFNEPLSPEQFAALVAAAE
ncbi:MAG: EAL domain-containing protein [Alphaproteobacteria bacterium]|uniref:EAL domain-containing protein n=1 Tax=Candidatus Nitrobium versatile TaxID=2884831 RepID=A0A953JCW3_9BACT|nr:EAL domain-containing protein [Candidatus Nitrobium versatile]